MGRFLVDDDKVRALSATRQGRVSVGGFTYQAAYAVARLSSMLVGHDVLNLGDVPSVLRYDWAEDIDEVTTAGGALLTQCKRVDNIGQSAHLAHVLLGFAPKFLWTKAERRHDLRFRLVCTDVRFRTDGPRPLSEAIRGREGARARAAVMKILETPPARGSDRELWQAEAENYGVALVDDIWKQAEAIYLNSETRLADPTGVPLLAAEREGLDLLIRWSELDTRFQTDALQSLRRLIHNNLVTFDPVSNATVAPQRMTPRVVQKADVLAALFTLRPARATSYSFRVVGRQFLEDQAVKTKEVFVGRPPEWADVVHGVDPDVRFVERDFTPTLLEKVRTHILAPLTRGSIDRLPTLFVIGAPGGGKSTLIRRAAAVLVSLAEVTVADFSASLQGLQYKDIDSVVDAVAHLASRDRPVLMLLDDPFFAESGCAALLTRLARSGLPVGVLGASPDFLYEKFSHLALRGHVSVQVLILPPPSTRERTALLQLHGRNHETKPADEEDFIVLAMEAAAGVSFRDVVAKIWTTLNDGEPIAAFARPAALPWQVRAYLVVCFFHRFYERCPESVLREALALGNREAPGEYEYHLRQMTFSHGWRIFSVQEPGRLERYSGLLIGSSHSLVAREAWELRPAPAFDVADWVITASIRSLAPHAVGRLAGTLAHSPLRSDVEFGARLATAWGEAADRGEVPTSHLAELVTVLDPRDAQRLVPVLTRQATKLAEDSWLAALQLWRLSSSVPASRTFPETVDVNAIIETADFSRSSRGAVHFLRAVEHDATQYHEGRLRLWRSLEGGTSWQITSALLSWLLATRTASELTVPRLEDVRKWLTLHPEDAHVREQMLKLVEQFPRDSSLREEIFAETARWLEQHPDHINLRVAFVGIVERFAENNERRDSFYADTLRWLEQHPDDVHVREHFLGVMRRLARDTPLVLAALNQTIPWLDQHPEASNVRDGFLHLVERLPTESAIRQQAFTSTVRWLQNNPDDHRVRARFLKGVAQLPPESADLRDVVLEDTVRWLAEHPNDVEVRNALLGVVMLLPSGQPFRDEVLSDTVQWLERHQDDTRVRPRFLRVVARLPLDSPLRDAVAREMVSWLARHPDEVELRNTFDRMMKPQT